MRFAQEFWLYVVPLVPLLWLLLRAADRRAGARLRRLLGPDAASHAEGVNPKLHGWSRFLLLLGLFWLLLALARPQWGANEVSVTQRGSDIVIALDISNSMLAEDVVPNRLGRAITELTSFLGRLEDSRVGLVFFAGGAFVQCPLTIDYGTAEIFLKMAGPDMMSQQGTAIAAALETSRQLLSKGRTEGAPNNFQAILLVTDGEDLEGQWEEAARKCQSEGIKLLPVGVGDKEGGLIPAFDRHGRPDGFLKDEDGQVVMSRLDLASLEKMAGISGGSSFLIGVDGLAGDRLFAELQRLGRRDLEERRISSFKERYQWPLLMAVFCFAVRLLLHARRPNRGGLNPAAGRALGLGAILLLAAAQPAQAVLKPAGGQAATEGRQHYLAGDFEEALEKFQSALIEAPEDPRISLAIGETLFQLERYEEAAVEFERARTLAGEGELAAEALYNRGTTRLAAGQPDGAVEDLLESLSLQPDQPDALQNLEVAMRALQQQQQQQQDQDQNQDQQENQDQQDQQENQEQQDQQGEDQQDQQEDQQNEQQDSQENQQDQQENQDQQDQQQSEQDDQEPEADQQQDQSQEQPPEEGQQEMTREQALKLLNALDKDEEELKRSVQKRLKGGRPRSGKKW